MLKQLRLLLPLLFLSGYALAQNPNRTTIKGMIADTSGAEAAFATVMLLNPKDSALVNFTRGNDKGGFEFKNVRNAPYILKVSYVGYLPLQVRIEESPTDVNDLGLLRIKPITNELLEVVIRAAKATLSIRGDTVEYDASSFKVPPGSTVEDLLRRLPGIEVDAEGNIRAQGKDVKRVYVDGKTFFGDDPKAATKNLGAETLSKIQVYDEKSDQAKLTGVEDGKKEKAMNLELKEEYKKGSFGKITGAVGTIDRWAARGNYNRFNTKEQFSIIGYGNNINQTGVNWEDYGEFKGQNTFNDNDNGDFGFGNSRRFYYFGGDDSDVPFNNYDGRGLTENFGSGVNYNFDNKKTKLSSSYFYNQTDLDLEQLAFRQTFLSDSSFFNTDTTTRADFRGNHSLAARFEHEIDSNEVLIVKANGRYGMSNNQYRQNQLFSRDNDLPTNALSVNNDDDLNTWRMNATGIFRHRFKKKGRSFAVSAGYNNSRSDGTENLFSLNRFFQANTFTEQVRQLNSNENATQQVKSSLLFTEPLSKKWFWEAFYNFSKTDNKVDRQVANRLSGDERIDNLSRYFDNDVSYNRIGSSIRYSHQGLNASWGIAGQQIRLQSQYSIEEGMPLLAAPLDRKFSNLTPNVSLNYQLKNNIWINSSYSYGIREPRINDLQPVPNVNNPAFRVEGNPNLDPERMHSIEGGVGYWNPATFANMNIWVNYEKYDNQIVYNQLIENVEKIGIRTTTRPGNASGGANFSTGFWMSHPIVKTKLTASLNGNINLSQSPAFVNEVKNETDSRSYNSRLNLNFTPTQKLIMDFSLNLRFNNIFYSIQEEQNQNIRNHGINTSVKWQFASKFFFESNFNYSLFENERFGFRQELPIWNASVRRLFGKQSRIETRLAAFDLLNRRVSITQSGSQNFVIRNVANTLARYFMLSASYNMRGYENKLKKNDWW